MKEKRPNTCIAIAHYFLKLATKEKKGITNLKLQKLVYYAGVWNYTFFNKKLFNDNMEAWIHGPAIPRLYGYFKGFGSNPIAVPDIDNIKLPFDSKLEGLLNNIWHIYGKYDASYLEALTHSELPWQDARKDLDPGVPSKRTISLQKAKQYYAYRLKESKR